jgi:hypothetical protein
MTSGDVLAAHVRQLIQLDEQPQKAMLASLSAYADQTHRGKLLTHSTGRKKRSEHGPCSDLLPTGMPTDVHFTPPVPDNSATPEMALEPMKVMISGANMPIPVPALPYSCQTRADGPWRKIMQDIGGNVPTGTANLMRDLLAQAATRETSLGQQQSSQTQMTDETMAAMRWLTQQLEKQQQASVDMLCNILASSCSMEDVAGIDVPVQPSMTNSPLCTPEGLNRSRGSAAGGARTTSPPQGFLGGMLAPTLSSGKRMGNPMPVFGVERFPGERGRQQLQEEAGNSVPWQPMDRRPWQNARRSSMKAVPSQQSGPCATAAASVRDSGGPPETLRMHLQSLLRVDSNRVLIVRKINRLGFASQSALLAHFSWYGVVEQVLVAHSRVKCDSHSVGCGPVPSRLRPSGLGFIVMRRVAEAQAILAHGSEHQVNGMLIHVQQFERRMSAEGEGKEDDNETAIPETSPSEENCNSTTNSSSCEDSN